MLTAVLVAVADRQPSATSCLSHQWPCLLEDMADLGTLQGAPERVLARCTHLVSNAGGAPAQLSDASRRRVLQQVEQLGASRALRCLALAAKTVAAQHRQVNQGVLQQVVPNCRCLIRQLLWRWRRCYLPQPLCQTALKPVRQEALYRTAISIMSAAAVAATLRGKNICQQHALTSA